MSQSLNLLPVGLFTDPNSQSVAPSGGMTTASNVVIRRPGVVEPRNGFDKESTGLAAGTGFIRAIQPFMIGPGSTTRIYATDTPDPHASGPAWSGVSTVWDLRYDWNNSISGVIDPPYNYNYRFAEAHSQLALTTQSGLRRLTQSVYNALARWGIEPARAGAIPSIGSSGTRTWLVTNRACAFRVVYRVIRANGDVLRSAPSSRMIARNNSGSTQDVTLTVPVPAALAAGDIIELYRNANVATPYTAEPDDELQLSREYTVTSTDVSNGYATFYDDSAAVTDVGAYLYTSPSQEGILAANAPPPAARCLAFWNGMLWMGHTRTRQALTLTLTDINSQSGFHYEGTYTGKASTGRAYLDSMSSTAYLHVGMLVKGANVASPTYVTGINLDGANTVRVSPVCTGTDAGAVSYTFGDTLRIDSAIYAAGASNSTSTNEFAYVSTSVQDTIRNFVYVFNRTRTALHASDASTTSGQQGVVRIENLDPGVDNAETSFKAYSSIGTAFEPAIDAYSTATVAGTSTCDNWLNGVFWSKWQQPEAVPITNNVRLGSTSARVVGFGTTRDSLFVFKEDGIWRVSGTSDADLRFDPFDPTTVLLNPAAIASLDNALYCVTNKGVVRVTESGVDIVSQQIQSDLRNKIDKAQLYNAAGQDYWPMSATAKPSEQLVLFGIKDSAGTTDAADQVFVYCTKTNAWTSWALTPRCMAFDPATGQIVMGSDGSGYEVRRERLALSDTFSGMHCSDESYTITISSCSAAGAAVLNNGSSGYSPAVGDIIINSSTLYRITAVTDGTHVTLDAASGTGSSTAYKGYACTVRYNSNAVDNIGVQKHWREVSLFFDDLVNAKVLTGNFYTELSTSAATTTATITTPQTTANQRVVRLGIPRAAARATEIGVGFAMTHAAVPFKHSGASVVFEQMSERTRKTP